MAHTLEQTGESETDHVFTCTTCGKVCGFNRHGLGDPCCDDQGNPPADPETWMGPCLE